VRGNIDQARRSRLKTRLHRRGAPLFNIKVIKVKAENDQLNIKGQNGTAQKTRPSPQGQLGGSYRKEEMIKGGPNSGLRGFVILSKKQVVKRKPKKKKKKGKDGRCPKKEWS